MDVAGNFAEAVITVISSVETAHDGREGLCGTDVRESFLAFDVLLATLEGEAESRFTVDIFRNTNEATRHKAFVLFVRSEISGGRTTEIEWHTEALGRTESDVGTEFSRRGEEYETHDVGGNGYFGTCCMSFFNKSTIVGNSTVCIRILKNSTEYRSREIEFVEVTIYKFYALWHTASGKHIFCLTEYFVVNKEFVDACFLLVAATEGVHHSHSLCSGSSLVKKRAVGKFKTCKVGNHCLEIEKSLKTSL